MDSEIVEEVAEATGEATVGIFNFLSDYKVFIVFGLSLIICFAIVFFIFYKKQEPKEDNQTQNAIEAYKKQNTELIKQNNNLAKQLQFVQDKPPEYVPQQPEIQQPNTIPEPKKKRTTMNNPIPPNDEPQPRNEPTPQEINEYARSIKEQFMQSIDDVEIPDEEELEQPVMSQQVVDDDSDSEINIDVDDILESV